MCYIYDNIVHRQPSLLVLFAKTAHRRIFTAQVSTVADEGALYPGSIVQPCSRLDLSAS